MLRLRAWLSAESTAGRAPTLNLAIVGAFALAAFLLLTKTAYDATQIDDDIGGAITPQLSAVDGDLEALALLDRTGVLTERIATGLLPIAEGLGRAADATTTMVEETNGIRDDSDSTRIHVANIDASVSAIRALLGDLSPVVKAIVEGVGDIRTTLAAADRQTALAKSGLDRAVAATEGIATDAAAVRARAEEIEAVLRRIEKHGANVAAAKILDCPSDSRACFPRPAR
ncbi:MAG: hypothetical protein ACT4QG_05805 [Sporichthyaceae bacterium]